MPTCLPVWLLLYYCQIYFSLRAGLPDVALKAADKASDAVQQRNTGCTVKQLLQHWLDNAASFRERHGAHLIGDCERLLQSYNSKQVQHWGYFLGVDSVHTMLVAAAAAMHKGVLGCWCLGCSVQVWRSLVLASSAGCAMRLHVAHAAPTILLAMHANVLVRVPVAFYPLLGISINGVQQVSLKQDFQLLVCALLAGHNLTLDALSKHNPKLLLTMEDYLWVKLSLVSTTASPAGGGIGGAGSGLFSGAAQGSGEPRMGLNGLGAAEQGERGRERGLCEHKRSHSGPACHSARLPLPVSCIAACSPACCQTTLQSPPHGCMVACLLVLWPGSGCLATCCCQPTKPMCSVIWLLLQHTRWEPCRLNSTAGTASTTPATARTPWCTSRCCC